ncbi:MAG: hypothetical protein Q9210_002542 [Variospora velana]
MKAEFDHAKEIGGEAKYDTIGLISSRLRNRDTFSPVRTPQAQLEYKPSFGELGEFHDHALHALKLASVPALKERLFQALKEQPSQALEEHALKERLDQAFEKSLEQLHRVKDFVELAAGVTKELRDMLVQQGSTRRKRRRVKRKRQEGE